MRGNPEVTGLGKSGRPSAQNRPEAPRHFGEPQERIRTVPSDHKSKSERDWAYAKRALARGDDPEVVIQRIADYRSDDKGDPNYYCP